jgi:hypothetical protein
MKKGAIILFFLLSLGIFTYADELSEKEKIIAAIQEQDEMHTRDGKKIIHIQRVNMGIPGGENWLAEWNDSRLSFYSLDSNYIIITKFFGRYNLAHYFSFGVDIVKDIPGIRIRDGYDVVGDYNDDGLDEIFGYSLPGSYISIFISGYSVINNKVEYYCCSAHAELAEIRKSL